MKYEAKENDEIVESEGIRYAVKEAWRSETGERTVLARAVRLGDETVVEDEYCAYLLEATVKEDGTHEVIGDAGYEEEDDGGTIKEWNCTALVRVESKSYGVELKIPFHSYDDIVWRGSLGRKWFEANSNTVGHFGDVDLTFELI